MKTIGDFLLKSSANLGIAIAGKSAIIGSGEFNLIVSLTASFIYTREVLC